jgi:hypothetical protein
VVDLKQLDSTLDLWLCMWEPAEQESFETALVRSMTDQHPRPRRLMALAACHIIATPRLLAAASRIDERGVFTPDEVEWIERATVSRYNMIRASHRLRGNVLGVELLLARFVSALAADSDDLEADALLSWVDVRDLVAVARTTLDSRLFSEVERRLAHRGKYQRGRVANVLGFTIRPPLTGEWGIQSPEIGDLGPTGT